MTTFFFFQKDSAQVLCACNTIQLSENVIFVFSRFARQCRIVKRLLIAYFIGNISAKKISKSIHVCQSYSKPNVGRFLRHGVVAEMSVSA